MFIILCFFSLSSYISYLLFAHVQTRVAIWLHPWDDPMGSAYQIVQSLFAFGYGGVFGTGYTSGFPRLIPEVHTDFIFAAIGEEFGLMGVTFLLLAYLLLFMRGIKAALLLTNEKYTGDVLLQKTYTDSHFNRHTNYGEKNMYLVENHHEAIISHEDFEAVDVVLNQRAKEKGIEKRNSKYQNRYSFSGKIICSECGSTFKRRIHSSGRKYVAWCCSKHIGNITECSMQFIRDEDIKTAFVTMMNKLIYGQKFILRPLLNRLRNQNNVASFRRIEELETKIENNMEQSQMLTGLMAKGYLEPDLFNKEKNSLEAERERLLVEKDQLTRSVNGNFTKVEEVDRLLKFATKSQMLTAYEDELFENYVEKIMVFSREEVGFELKCGITLKERLVN